MQTFLIIVRIAALVGGIIGAFNLLGSLFPEMDGWKRAGAAFMCGLMVFSIACSITQTDAERKQSAAQQAAQKAQIQESEKTKKELVAKKQEPEQAQEKPNKKPKPKLSSEEIAQAKHAVQKFIEDDIFQKVDVISDDDGLVDVWTGSKFAAIPYDWKKNALEFVYVAYCNKTPNGYIRLNDGYTGKKAGVYTLRSGLELD